MTQALNDVFFVNAKERWIAADRASLVHNGSNVIVRIPGDPRLLNLIIQARTIFNSGNDDVQVDTLAIHIEVVGEGRATFLSQITGLIIRVAGCLIDVEDAISCRRATRVRRVVDLTVWLCCLLFIITCPWRSVRLI